MPLNVLPRRAACLIDGVLLLPAYPAIHVPGLVVSFIAEVGLALWLLVKGVKVVDSGASRARPQRESGPQAEGRAW